MRMKACVSAQGSLVHGTFGRALLAGGAALQPDERAAEPHRGQNVFAAARPSTASTSHAPTGRDKATLGDQVGQETTRTLSFTPPQKTLTVKGAQGACQKVTVVLVSNFSKTVNLAHLMLEADSSVKKYGKCCFTLCLI